ncbi:MAG: 1-acyl-sn-glycerol-3-phosphate acyltransferase, partial [Bacteroidota bacterium]
PMLLSWIWTLGIMGLTGIPFTIFNIIISTFIFGLGIDYAIFIMRGLMKAYKTGEDHLPSFKSSVFLSAVTTVLGMGVLIGAKHPSLQSMAALSLVGISSVVFISYTVEPALFSWFLLRRQQKGKPAYTLRQVILSGIGYSIFAIGASHATLYGLIMDIFGIRSHKGQKLLHYLIMWSNRFLIYGMVNVKKRIINPFREDHRKPAIIIANHQSHLDLILLMMLHPKFIILTNEWVQNHKIYGRLVRLAGYLPVSIGYEALAEALKPKVDRGYSIVIFPEGTRSTNFKMKRFHKGAFFLAEKLQLDILPIALHGTGHAMTKGDDLLLKPQAITLEYLPRITLDDPRFPTPYNKRAKAIGQYFRAHYRHMREKQETPAYFRDKLLKNYLYKGPVLEWYARIKTKLEKNYHFFHNRLPAEGTIVDIGCGYGFLSYMLYFTNNNRNILGIDYDEEKIAVARNIPDRNKNVTFLCTDIISQQLPEAEAFVLNDVLHYMPREDQQRVLDRCLRQLKPGGICIIREANAKLKKRHIGTRTTEFFSTRFLGFNKTADESKALYFPTDEDIFAVTRNHLVEVKVLDNSKHTSNVVYLITKKDPQHE